MAWLIPGSVGSYISAYWYAYPKSLPNLAGVNVGNNGVNVSNADVNVGNAGVNAATPGVVALSAPALCFHIG